MKTRDQRGETRDQRPATSDPAAVRAGSRRFGRWPLVSGPWSRAQRDRGFALLLVVTLLAFIVLLLLGLAVYTRIETGVAGNTQRQAQARENALLGLNVALAQLQRYAGPDERITATAESFPNNTSTARYAGVWPANTIDAAPLTWLVSGNEFSGADPSPDAVEGAMLLLPLAVTPTSVTPGPQTVDLIGRNTTGRATRNSDYVTVPLVPLQARGIPGRPSATATTIGRYAWWVGDQGVKAPVAVPDPTASVTYEPYATSDARTRLRQQIPLGAGALDAVSRLPSFDPRDGASATLTAGFKVTTPSQFAFLKQASADGAAVTAAAAAIGLAKSQQHFHHWSPNNFAVLASTAPTSAGLRRDLSITPGLLGAGFSAWANYDPATGGYMEPPVPQAPDAVPLFPPPSPDYSATNPVRRRYFMQPSMAADGVQHGVAPVLSYFLLSFNVRTEPPNASSKDGSEAPSPVQARARFGVSLWNPYTSSLVPENLRLEVTGMPDHFHLENATTPNASFRFDLQSLFDGGNGTIKWDLPWDSTTSSNRDRQSWLPGRTYSWVSVENKDGTLGANGFETRYYSQSIDGVGGQGIHKGLSRGLIDGNDLCYLRSGECTLRVSVYAVRSGGDVLLQTFTSPEFMPLTTGTDELHKGTYSITYLFRLREGGNPAWLQTPAVDFRASAPPASIFEAGPNGPDPAASPNWNAFSSPDRLLDRATNELSYEGDTPVFELPRYPLLSLGALQHLILDNARPFSIGNSWGSDSVIGGVRAAELADRFFFSGLTSTTVPPVDAAGNWLPPNPLQVPLRKPDGLRASPDDLRLAPESQSSKHLLQGAAFNINSTSVVAWAAVLRNVRFPAPQSFRFLGADFSNGATSDTDTSTTPVVSPNAQFFRFSQSAQETYKATPPLGGITWSASTVAPPDPADPTTANNIPAPGSAANTYLYRQGMRTLTATQVLDSINSRDAGLAGKIVELIKARHETAGPFRSLQAFLSAPVPGEPSLLERAIAEAEWTDNSTGVPVAKIGLNVDIPEFSSQWLTQADILTALAPIIFARSDTFIIRAYGEAVNPALLNNDGSVPPNAVEGRAWCEALVQRVPEYFDRKDNDNDPTGDYPETSPANLSSDLNKIHGRRFKVVSFRWLTRSDI